MVLGDLMDDQPLTVALRALWVHGTSGVVPGHTHQVVTAPGKPVDALFLGRYAYDPEGGVWIAAIRGPTFFTEEEESEEQLLHKVDAAYESLQPAGANAALIVGRVSLEEFDAD